MSDLEKRAITALRSVRMPEKNWHARAAERLNMWATLRAEQRLPIAEASDLWFLVWRYRRQIDDGELVAKANEIVNGAMSLAF